MTRIYYDEDDKEAIQLIDDYYWFKYMISMIYNDWKNSVEWDGWYNKEITLKSYKNIVNYLNIHDLKRLKSIVKKMWGVCWCMNFHGFLGCLFNYDDKLFIRLFKEHLVKKYKNI